MSDETVEPFRDKLIHMILPRRPKNKNSRNADLETVDPLERFEKAIKKDAEEGQKKRRKQSGNN